ncbi:MAG: DUF5677 domain-containing protein [Pseudomonadota bacterium]|nr:DUF5677 domain-containing protein [Pseudomonadota bacterium]
MGQLQSVLHAQIRKTPQLALEQILERKLEEDGIKLSKAGRKAFAEHILTHGESKEFTWRGGNGTDNKTIKFDETDAEELSRMTRRLAESMPEIVDKLSKSAAKDYLKNLLAAWPERDDWELLVNAGFRERLQERWGEGLGLLRMLLTVCREVGGEQQTLLNRSKAKKALPYARSALVRLHIRACQVSSETITLMEGGFADGAMARWRTLYEIAVVSDLIAVAGDDLGHRYLAHDVIDEKEAIEAYVRTQVPLGYKPPSAAVLKSLERRVAAAVTRFGPEFKRPNGWAAKHLGITGKQKVRFCDLENAAGRTGMKSIYKAASYPVHAGARSLYYSHAQLDPFDGPTAGATNAGLLVPGQNLAYTLVQITGNLLSKRRNTLDHIVDLRVLVSLRDLVPPALQRAERQLRKDEAGMH